MCHDLPSCRKLIIDLKHEVQKRYALLNTLKRLPHTPKTALVWAHLASFIQTAQAVITCAKHNQYIALPPLLRMAGECAVNCRLVLEQCSDKNALMAGLTEKRKYINKINQKLRNQYSEDEIETTASYKDELNRKIDEIEEDEGGDYVNWSIEERWKAIGEDMLYQACYTLLSSDVHSNPAALDRRHTAEIDGQPTLIWYKHGVEEAQSLLGIMFTFFKIAEPCFVALPKMFVHDDE